MLDYGYGDAIEREEAERADDDSERARELLNASAVRFCAACARPVLTRRDRTCLWCDGPTTLPVVGEHHETVSTSRPRLIRCGPASDPSEGAGCSGNRKEAA